jgi:hypothetical protein
MDDELLQEIKALRADVQKLPEQLVTKLGTLINRELWTLFWVVVGAGIVGWLYQHFWK